MFRKWIKRVAFAAGMLFAAAALVIFLPKLVTTTSAESKIFEAANAPSKPVAVVFGAGLRRDGYPTRVLRDRVKTASQLYFDGKVDALLMSGDNRTSDYNEPASMRDYAVELGVPKDAISLDYAGRRTYDTCYRAKEIFGVQEAVLVTQEFHLPRALYLCSQLGIDAVGVRANQYRYWSSTLAVWNIRETLATVVALWDVHFSKPVPILGEPEPIFPSDA